MKIGAQIYSMRKIINNDSDLRSVFQFLNANGAEAVEMVDFSWLTPSSLKTIANDTGIEIGSTHSNYNRLKNETAMLIEEHLEYGCNIVGLGMMPLNEYNILKKDSILRFCDDMNKAADIAKPYGVTIDYHNHAFEFNKLGGERILDIIINNTADNVKLCFDMYWARAAKSSVQEYLNNHANKINVVHFKDYKKKFIGSKYTTVGEGELDIAGIYKLAESKGVLYGYVEHDNPTDPKQVISAGLSCLKSVR